MKIITKKSIMAFAMIFIFNSFLPRLLFSQINRQIDKEGWGDDPFVSVFDLYNIEQEKKRAKELEKLNRLQLKEKITQEVEQLTLSGILKGRDNLAIINGEIYEEGNFIDGKEIIKIEDEYVILRQAEFTFELRLIY